MKIVINIPVGLETAQQWADDHDPVTVTRGEDVYSGTVDAVDDPEACRPGCGCI